MDAAGERGAARAGLLLLLSVALFPVEAQFVSHGVQLQGRSQSRAPETMHDGCASSCQLRVPRPSKTGLSIRLCRENTR